MKHLSISIPTLVQPVADNDVKTTTVDSIEWTFNVANDFFSVIFTN